jgi:hypothetical protein
MVHRPMSGMEVAGAVQEAAKLRRRDAVFAPLSVALQAYVDKSFICKAMFDAAKGGHCPVRRSRGIGKTGGLRAFWISVGYERV